MDKSSKIVTINSYNNKLHQKEVWSVFKRILRFSISSVYLKSTEESAKSKEIMQKHAKLVQNLKSYLEKRLRDKKTTSVPLKSKNYKILRQRKKRNSLSFHRLGIII